MINVVMRDVIPSDEPKVYHNNKVIYGHVIRYAGLELRYGSQDPFKTKEEDIEIRVDALLFFIDGRYQGIMEYIGFEIPDNFYPIIEAVRSTRITIKVEQIIHAIAHIIVKKYHIEPISPEHVILEAHRLGFLNDGRIWEQFDNAYKHYGLNKLSWKY